AWSRDPGWPAELRLASQDPSFPFPQCPLPECTRDRIVGLPPPRGAIHRFGKRSCACQKNPKERRPFSGLWGGTGWFRLTRGNRRNRAQEWRLAWRRMGPCLQASGGLPAEEGGSRGYPGLGDGGRKGTGTLPGEGDL